MNSVKPNKQLTARRIILTSFIVDFSDVILNLAVALMTGSMIMISELLEGVADLVASGLLLVGINKSRQKEDKSHPFGYGRELYFWTLMSALIMMGITSTFSIYFGVQRYLKPEPITHIWLAYTVLTISVVTNAFAFTLSLKRLLQSHHLAQILNIFIRSSLVETKTTLILDLMGTLAALLGFISLVIYQLTGDLRMDGVGAILIGLMLAVFAYLILIGAKDLLVGQTASIETEETIRKSALRIKEVKDVINLKTMHLGPERLLVNLEVNLDNELTTNQIEGLIHSIKEEIRKDVPVAKNIQVELETQGP